MAVCRTRAERLSVSVAKNKAILFGDNVGVTLKNARSTRAENSSSEGGSISNVTAVSRT